MTWRFLIAVVFTLLAAPVLLGGSFAGQAWAQGDAVLTAFAAADADSDLHLAPNELASLPAAFRAYGVDRNADGKVSMQEYMETAIQDSALRNRGRPADDLALVRKNDPNWPLTPQDAWDREQKAARELRAAIEPIEQSAAGDALAIRAYYMSWSDLPLVIDMRDGEDGQGLVRVVSHAQRQRPRRETRITLSARDWRALRQRLVGYRQDAIDEWSSHKYTDGWITACADAGPHVEIASAGRLLPHVVDYEGSCTDDWETLIYLRMRDEVMRRIPGCRDKVRRQGVDLHEPQGTEAAFAVADCLETAR